MANNKFLLSRVDQLPPLPRSVLSTALEFKLGMKEQDGKRWLICQDPALLFYLSARVWMKYWLEAWSCWPPASEYLPWHGWLTEIIGRERKRKNNRPCFITSNQYLIWKAGKVLTMQSLSISVIITNALFQPPALKPSQRRRKICRNVAAQVITIQNYSLIIMPDLLAGIYFSQT